MKMNIQHKTKWLDCEQGDEEAAKDFRGGVEETAQGGKKYAFSETTTTTEIEGI